MSEFSECFNRIRVNKNLYAADIARLMNMDSSTISKWLNGERKPKNREVLEKLLNKMKLSDVDRKLLTEAYEEEFIGKEKYQCIKLWFEIIKEIQNKRKYTTKIELGGVKQDCVDAALPVTNYANRIELLQGIQNVFNYIMCRNIKKIYLRFDIFNPDVMLLLNMFINKGYECEIDLIIFPKSASIDQKVFALSLMKEVISLWAENASFQIYISENVDELNSEDNFIMTDEFVLQYHQDLSGGLLSSEASWINFWKDKFISWKKICRRLFSLTSIDNIFDRYNSWTENEPCDNMSWEYMPCFAMMLDEDTLNRFLYDTLPVKEQMMQMILEVIVMSESDNKNPKTLLNWFSMEGLRSFMDNGVFSTLPQEPFYNPVSLPDCIKILERYIYMSSIGRMKPQLVKDEYNLTLKDVFIEPSFGEPQFLRFSLSNNEVLTSKIMNINDKDIVESYMEFCDYLCNAGYVMSIEDTIEKLKDVLEEYKGKIDKV